jgi:hypothetical protein
VKLWVAGTEKNLGFTLTCDSTNGWDFESSQAETVEHRPLLTISYTPPPESAAIEEILMGMQGCFRQISPWLLEQLIWCVAPDGRARRR